MGCLNVVLRGFLFVCLLLPVTAFSADYHVDKTNGSDANDGSSWSNAKLTIQAAMTLATSVGDRVLVAAATYNEAVTFLPHDDLQLLGGYPAGGGTQDPATNLTIIDGTGLNKSLITIPGDKTSSFNQHSYMDLVVDGFTLQNMLLTTGTSSDAAAISSESADLTIKRCTIKDNTNNLAFGRTGGINVLSLFHNTAAELKIEETVIRDNTGLVAGGIYVEAFHNTGSFDFGALTVTMKNCLIEGNQATITGTPAVGAAGGAVIGVGGQRFAAVNITNCTVADNTSANTNPIGGFYFGMDSIFNYVVKFKNSIIWHPGQDDIFQEFDDGLVTARATYSIINDTNDSPFTYFTGVIHSDPNFIGGGDYQLSAGSPAINSGTSSGAPLVDLLGVTRPFNGAFDMGAYEYDVPDLPPVVDNPIADVTVDEDAADSVINLSGVFSDPETDPITLSVVGNTNTALVDTSLVGTTLTLDYLADQSGSANITVRATANGQTVDDSFQVTVNAVDDPPMLIGSIVDVTVDEDALDTVIDLSTVFNDIDGVMAFSVESNSNMSLLSTGIAGSNLTLTYAANTSGNAELTVRATSDGEFVEDSFSVTVNALDDAPEVVNPIADVSVNEDAPDTVIDLSNVFNDVDSAVITFTIQANTDASIVNPNLSGNNLTLHFLPNQNGSADITIRASADGQIVDDIFNADIVAVNDPPVFTSSTNLIFTDGETEVDQVTASDIENDSLTFMLVGGDDQALFSLTPTGELSFIAPPDLANPLDLNADNKYEIIIEVFDGVDSVQQAITVLASECSFFIIRANNGNFTVVCI